MRVEVKFAGTADVALRSVDEAPTWVGEANTEIEAIRLANLQWGTELVEGERYEVKRPGAARRRVRLLCVLQEAD